MKQGRDSPEVAAEKQRRLLGQPGGGKRVDRLIQARSHTAYGRRLSPDLDIEMLDKRMRSYPYQQREGS